MQEKAKTKKDIVKEISDEMGLTQVDVKKVVQRTFDAIIETLVKDGRIELRNFGVFEVKQRKPRKARNPRTGQQVHVDAKNVVTFKPGKEMQEKVRRFFSPGEGGDHNPPQDAGETSEGDVESSTPSTSYL